MNPIELIKIEQISKEPGIYAIICKGSNKCYVGRSKNVYRRWVDHKEKLNKGVHDNNYLQRSWSKYGKEYFFFIVLEYCQEYVLGQKEIEWILKFDEKSLFNTGCVGGYTDKKNFSVRSAAQKRKWENPIFREKMRLGLKGRKMPNGFGEKVGKRCKGKKLSKEHINNIVLSKKGKPISLQNKLNLLSSRKRKFTSYQVDEIRQKFLDGKLIKDLKKEYSVSDYVIFNIVRGRSYILDCDAILIERCRTHNRQKN